MSKMLIKIEHWYFEWSTIADAPTTKGMELPLLAYHIAESYGESGLRDLPMRLDRIRQTGTSSIDGTTLDELLSANRAGPGEKHLTAEELLAQYVPTRPARGPWSTAPCTTSAPPVKP